MSPEDRRAEYLRRHCQYVRNTAQVPLRIVDFDDDHEPAGPDIRRMMRDEGLIDYQDDGVVLTAKGEAML